MDARTTKEIEKLHAEAEAASEELEASKYLFARQLQGEMGKQMIEELNNPSKPNLLTGIKNRIRRRKTIRDNKREAHKIKKGDI